MATLRSLTLDGRRQTNKKSEKKAGARERRSESVEEKAEIA
jgi:hypothetical protein